MTSFIQLNLGCLSRNCYWGEENSHAYRTARCSSVLLENERKQILIDPGVSYDEMKILLDERCGKKIEDIDYVFFTHLHGDHRVDALKYENAVLYANSLEIQELRMSGEEKELAARLLPVNDVSFSGVRPVWLPGHTRGCTGLAFESKYGPSLVAGDSVMTEDFFLRETGYFNSWDFDVTTETIQGIKQKYRLIIPGHDIFFINDTPQSLKGDFIYDRGHESYEKVCSKNGS